jgi:hypothetical protein
MNTSFLVTWGAVIILILILFHLAKSRDRSFDSRGPVFCGMCKWAETDAKRITVYCNHPRETRYGASCTLGDLKNADYTCRDYEEVV